MKYSIGAGRLSAITADLDRLAGFDDDFLLEEAWSSASSSTSATSSK